MALHEHNSGESSRPFSGNSQSSKHIFTEDRPPSSESSHLHDPFEFAPAHSEGDPWTLLLEPLLRQDHIQCNAWKDEVQNLLIFAGLFSAVVTTFIIESYKTLQPDPTNTMIDLLSQIAIRPDGSLNSTSTLPASSVQQFSPTASSIRVNNFWFISLVLSLTTALIGIISLQWLREHQSYRPNMPSRDKYALFNMRSEALKTWHVHTIFTSLPLLLQSALILFLGGIIDFLSTFGHITVLIPVTVIVGCTLCFLIGTTALPTLQTMGLYFNVPPKLSHSGTKPPSSLLPSQGSYLKSVPPNQCPYKSPQSWAIRALWRTCYRMLDRYAPTFTKHIPYICYIARMSIHSIWKRVTRPLFRTSEPLVSYDDHQNFVRYLSGASANHESWIDFDMTWLAIRDQYMQSAFGRSFPPRPGLPNDVNPPFYDIIQGLCWKDGPRASSTAAYRCFGEISEWTLTYLNNKSLHDVFRHQTVYLCDLLNVSNECLLHMFDFDSLFFSERCLESSILQSRRQDVYAVLNLHNISFFLGILLYRSGSPGWPSKDRRWSARHRLEIKNRLMRYFFDSVERPFKNISFSHLQFPESVGFDVIDMISISVEYRRFEHGEESFKVLAWQLASFALWVFQHCDKEPHNKSLLHNEHALENLRNSVVIAGSITRDSLGFPSGSSAEAEELDQKTREAFDTLCICIERHLDDEMKRWPTGSTNPETPTKNVQPKPILLFVLATLYADGVLRRASTLNEDPVFCSMLFKLREYQMGTMNLDCDVSVRRMRFPYLERWWDNVSVGLSRSNSVHVASVKGSEG